MNEQTLSQWPVEIEIPVAWGDMDSFRHVNNTVYLRWFESSRIVYFQRVGLLDVDGVGPILAKISVNYRRPVVYPDTVIVGSTVTQFGKTSFLMSYRAYSKKLDQIVADADSVIVMFDYRTQEKTLVDDALRARIFTLESTPR